MPSAPKIILTGRDSYPTAKPTARIRGGGNQLIPTATQNNDRKRVPFLDRDIHRNVTECGRRVMMSIGLRLYSASDVVRGTIEDIARSTASTFLCEYRGADAEFKRQVEAYTYAHDRVCDIAAGPYTGRTYRKMIVRSILREGDIGTVYTLDENGAPRIQVIPGHRIASDKEFVEGGPLDGSEIIDGVIVGEQFQPLAYRVLLGDGSDYSNFVDVPADRMLLTFIPLFPGQVRGFSLLGFSAWNFQDRDEARRWELLAQKAGAGRVFKEWNENGEPPSGADYINAPASTDSTEGTPSGLWFETIDGGLNTYFKSTDPNSNIEAVKFDRPSSNQQAFADDIAREALYAAGWSPDFALNPTKIGGAPLRVLVDKLNATKEDIEAEVLEPAVRRLDAHRIPVAMRRREIKTVDDWFNLEYQTAAKMTADKKYDSDVTLQEVKFGIKSRSKACMERGETQPDVLEANKAAVRTIFQAAQELANEFKIPFELALARLEQATPNESGLMFQQQQQRASEE